MVDFDPNDHTAHSTSPAAPLSADDVVSHLRAIASTPPGQQSLWDCTVAAWAADELVAREKALDGLDSSLRDIGRVVGYEAGCDAHEVLVRVRKALEALTAENARLTEQLGKYAMPPWEADRHKREALAARRALCLGEHADNVAPADIHDRIVALRTAKETYREDVR